MVPHPRTGCDAYSLKLLLGRGADPFHLTKYNEASLLYAVSRNFATGIKLLLEVIISSEKISRRKLVEDVHLIWHRHFMALSGTLQESCSGFTTMILTAQR